MTLTYQNKYGCLEFEVVGPYKQVNAIQGKEIDQSLYLEIEMAEKVALITENKGIQLSVAPDFKKMYLIHHQASNIAAVCRLTKLEFNPDFNATAELTKNPKACSIY